MYGMSFQVKHIGILFCLLMAQPLQLLVKILLDLFGGGGFDYRDDDARALTNIGLDRNVYFVADSPNQGIVWSFEEGFEGSSGVDYVSELYAYTEIFKNNLTGGGNTTSVSFQYTHTYQAYTGSVSVSFSSSGLSPSFTISTIPANWTISAHVSGLKY